MELRYSYKYFLFIIIANPPYSQNVADHISERHMPLPVVYSGPNAHRGPTNKEISDKIKCDIQKY
jgi:hypothetical protein